MLSYEFKPESINEVVPSPRYVDKALNRDQSSIRMSKYSLETQRTSALVKRQNEARYAQGRLYSHLKLHQIKQSVIEVRRAEQNAAKKGMR